MLALPLGIWLFAPLRRRATASMADFDERRRQDKAALQAALARLPRHHSRETIAGWSAAAQQGRLPELVTDLMLQHYDPAYRRGAAARRSVLLRIMLERMSDSDLQEAARRIAETVAQVSAPGPGRSQEA